MGVAELLLLVTQRVLLLCEPEDRQIAEDFLLAKETSFIGYCCCCCAADDDDAGLNCDKFYA